MEEKRTSDADAKLLHEMLKDATTLRKTVERNLREINRQKAKLKDPMPEGDNVIPPGRGAIAEQLEDALRQLEEGIFALGAHEGQGR
jgi:hypothetical protein